jgi:hypothetical protein
MLLNSLDEHWPGHKITDPKKTPSGKNSRYKIEAAARRAKIASIGAPIAHEIKPLQRRIRATLDGKAIRMRASVFGPASIDISEFSTVRKKKHV